jgi:hypothetical protein
MFFNRKYSDVEYTKLRDSTKDVLLGHGLGVHLQLDYNFYPIYDMNAVRYAFLIPLKNGDTYSGFVIMGAIDNYYEPLVVSDNEPLLTEALVEHARYNEIIFNFPFGFIVKQGADMYEISHDLSLNRVAVEENESDTSSYNPCLVTELLRIKGQYKEPIIKDYNVSLSGEYEIFYTAVDPDNFYIDGSYGGEQQWLADYGYISQFWADRSCGVAAAANVAWYLGKNKLWAYTLYGNRPDTEAAFTENMYDIYGYLSPAIWGMPDLSTMRSRFVDFAQSRKVSLFPVIDDSPWTIVNVSNYIMDGLNYGCPVLMVTWNSDIEDLEYHWVTITKYYTSSGTRYVTTSNWGRRRVYNLDIWFSSGSIYQGVQYFKWVF